MTQSLVGYARDGTAAVAKCRHAVPCQTAHVCVLLCYGDGVHCARSRGDVLRPSAQTLRNEPVGPEADLWALGCIIYQMLVGKAPFRAASEYLTFERIASGKMRVPSDVPAAAADVIKRLLRAEPAKRLGACASVCTV